MRSILIALLLAMVTLAGCSNDSTEVPGDSGLDDESGSPELEDTSDGNDTMEIAPPSLNFTSDTLEGQAPLQVQFDFNAFAVNMSNLTWTLDVDGDGEPEVAGPASSLPANHTFTYNAAGEFNATFQVQDGDLVYNETRTIRVSEPEPVPEGDYEFPEDPLCKTDANALEIPGTGLFATPDDIPLPYLYEEANGVPGLQRNDAAWDANCEDPDFLIF